MSVKMDVDMSFLAGVGEAVLGVADWDGSDMLAARDDLRALRDIVEGTARGMGEEFFRSLVRLGKASKPPFSNPGGQDDRQGHHAP
jgi:hypothetical protein